MKRNNVHTMKQGIYLTYLRIIRSFNILRQRAWEWLFPDLLGRGKWAGVTFRDTSQLQIYNPRNINKKNFKLWKKLKLKWNATMTWTVALNSRQKRKTAKAKCKTKRRRLKLLTTRILDEGTWVCPENFYIFECNMTNMHIYITRDRPYVKLLY